MVCKCFPLLWGLSFTSWQYPLMPFLYRIDFNSFVCSSGVSVDIVVLSTIIFHKHLGRLYIQIFNLGTFLSFFDILSKGSCNNLLLLCIVEVEKVGKVFLCFLSLEKNHLLPLSMLIAVKLLFWFVSKNVLEIIWLRHVFSWWTFGRFLGYKKYDLILCSNNTLYTNGLHLPCEWKMMEAWEGREAGPQKGIACFGSFSCLSPLAFWLLELKNSLYHMLPGMVFCFYSGWHLWGQVTTEPPEQWAKWNVGSL